MHSKVVASPSSSGAAAQEADTTGRPETAYRARCALSEGVFEFGSRPRRLQAGWPHQWCRTCNRQPK
eukprot:10065363-Alexandrium_andersonii.AAC.1